MYAKGETTAGPATALVGKLSSHPTPAPPTSHLSLLTSHFSPLTSHASLPAGQSQFFGSTLHSLEDDLNVLFQRNA